MKWDEKLQALQLDEGDVFCENGNEADYSVDEINKKLKEWFDSCETDRIFLNSNNVWQSETIGNPATHTHTCKWTGITPIKPATCEDALRELLDVISHVEFEHGDRFTVGINDQTRARAAVQQAKEILSRGETK